MTKLFFQPPAKKEIVHKKIPVKGSKNYFFSHRLDRKKNNFFGYAAALDRNFFMNKRKTSGG
jgi:hypothetical protein